MQRRRTGRGFTLIELMVTIAIAGLLAMLVAPSFQDMILMQRLRGVNAQVVTDLQFARAEAVARARYVRFNLSSNTEQSCYVIYLADGNGVDRCDCLNGAGTACPAGDGRVEIKTVSVPVSSKVGLSIAVVLPSTELDTAFAFDYVTGGLLGIPSDEQVIPLPTVQIDARIDDDRQLRNEILPTGRPRVCAPNPQRMQVPAC
jgi:type IV fimbrial biogenesis protein FimT